MSAVTAKVRLSQMNQSADGQTGLTFVPDYADGRNKEWALYTPAASFQMTVKASVAEHFTLGGAYTVTFEPSVEQPQEPTSTNLFNPTAITPEASA